MTEERVLDAIVAEGLAAVENRAGGFLPGTSGRKWRRRKIFHPGRSELMRCCFPPSKQRPKPQTALWSPARASSPLSARGWKINAEGFRAGETAIRPVTLFDVSRQRTKIAAEIDLPEKLPAHANVSEKNLRRLNRAARMLLLAAHEAWTQSGWQAGRKSAGRPRHHQRRNVAGSEIICEQAIGSPHSFKNQADARRLLSGAAAGTRLVRRLWISRAGHDHRQRLRLRRQRHRPRVGTWCAAAARKKF